MWLIPLIWVTLTAHNSQLTIGYFATNSSNLSATIGVIYNDSANIQTAYAVVGVALNELRRLNILQYWVELRASVIIGCEDGSGVGAAVDLYTKQNVSCIIGPACSSGMVGAAGLADYWNIPIVDFASTGSDLIDKNRFPTLARVSISWDYEAVAITFLLKHFGWQTIAIITDQVCNNFVTTFYASTLNTSITVQQIFLITDMTKDLDTISTLKTLARIFILCIGTEPKQARPVMVSLINNNMTTSGYVYIIPSFSTTSIGSSYSDAPWASNPPDGKDSEVQKAFYTNTFVVEQQQRTASYSLAQLKIAVAKYSLDHGFLRSAADGVTKDTPYLYDAVFLYGLALNSTIDLNLEQNFTNGQIIFDNMCNRTFYGMSGVVQTGSDGDRLALFSVMSFCPYGDANCTNDEGKNFTSLFDIRILNRKLSNVFSSAAMTVTYLRQSVFSTTDGKPPPDTPPCGFFWELCKAKIASENRMVALGSVLGVVGVLSIAVIGIFYWKRQRDHWHQLAQGWQIDINEIRMLPGYPNPTVSFEEMPTIFDIMTCRMMSHDRNRFSQDNRKLSLESVHANENGRDETETRDNAGLVNNTGNNARGNLTRMVSRTYLVGFAIYKGQAVVVKNGSVIVTKGHNPFNLPLSNQQLQDIRTVKEIRHENLNTFIGLSLVKGEQFVRTTMLWMQCSRGSLEEILFDTSQSVSSELDNIFKASMVNDIAKGLEHLHKLSVVHGALTTANCIVDSRWIAKITDYGLRSLFGWGTEKYMEYIAQWLKYGPRQQVDCTILQGLFHTAPEILNSYFKGGTPRFTKESDMFSLGIVFREIAVRRRPHEELSDLTPLEFLKRVAEQPQDCSRGALRLPSARYDTDFAELTNLTNECWQTNPRLRPTIGAARRFMEDKIKVTVNLVDHMLSQMENYATNLEKIIEERTGELYQERQRADELLKEMLPPSVAEELKAGRHVQPETFECVSLYFSDIVGFTSISAESTPVQVVAMLNLLYTGFDEIIKQHDAYKVETVGDAYMVVSGLPKRNGLKHVTEIANLTLAIRKFVANSFQIPHMARRSLAIRIGCHCGSVAAGVIGITMPKFCLFGDTVNTASRMESSGQPMKIHISEQMQQHLERNGNFQITERGIINIKGKGPTRTFWLESRMNSSR